MKLIEISKIVIPATRQRQDFNEASLRELVESIETHGLFHPIVLRIEGDSYVLVSGERRIRAVKDIYELGGELKFDDGVVRTGFIPYVYLGELDSLAAEDAELDENIKRTDLSWQERASVTARLASLRNSQSLLAGGIPSSVASVSEEAHGSDEGRAYQDTRREIIVSRYLDDPEVKAAKSLDDAWKLLKRKEATERNVSLAAEVGRTFTAEAHTAENDDSLLWMQGCPPDYFDVILTDPPYGMGADAFGDSGGKAQGAHSYSDTPEVYSRILTVAFAQLYRIAKPQAHLYWFCDIDTFTHTREMFSEGGWWVHRTPLIWHKPSAPRVPWPEHGPQRKYELILYAVKGKKPVNYIAPDVLTYNTDDNLGHQAQKPVALFLDLLKRSVRPGDTILDPFMGTGTIFPAAHELKCRATGIEIDPASYGIALGRLEQLKSEPELPI